MQMSVDSTVCWWEENFNVHPMQMRFIIKQNVQGLLRAGGGGKKRAAAPDTEPERHGRTGRGVGHRNPELIPGESAWQMPTPHKNRSYI